MILPTRDPKTARQLKTLAMLWVLLLVAVFSPTLRLGAGALHARNVRWGTAEISVPKGWMFSKDEGRLTVSKPCYTIFCRSARAGFIVETGKQSASSEKLWVNAARKTLARFAPDTTVSTVEVGSNTECVAMDSPFPDGKIMATCLNSDLHLTSTFRGELILMPVFYETLGTAHNR